MSPPSDQAEAARIKAHVRALYPTIGKLIVPPALAKVLREMDAWDDETMCEQKPIPLSGTTTLHL
jgi:hypothetical protein